MVQEANTQLQVPEGFGYVERELYRASKIEKLNIPFLVTLKLKTLVSLNPDMPSGVLKLFAERNKVALAHIGIQPWRSLTDWNLMGKPILQDALKFTLDQRNYPVLILDSANLFVGVLRKIQHWSYSSILAEYTAFAGIRAHYRTEIFLELIELQCIEHDEVHVPRQKSLPMITMSLDDGGITYQEPKRGMTLTLPPADVLPEWYRRQKQYWECQENPMHL